MATAKIKIEGMSCGHCVARVEKALKSLDGVKTAEVSLEKKEAKVEYDSTKIEIDKFKDAVKDTGYKVIG